MRKLIYSLVLATAIANAQPVIGTDGVVNAASYVPSGLPGSGIAQGSIFAAFGTAIGPASSPSLSFPLSTTLGGVSIKVTAGSASVDAIPLFVSPGQINAIMPSNAPLGDANLTVTFNGQASRPAPIKIVKSAFGIFTSNSGGTGPGVITDLNFAVDLLTASLNPGQNGIIWGTGIGAVSGNEAAGPLPGDLNVPVEVFVGGKPAKIIYRGRSGCCAGLDQIIFEVPAGVEGCYAPVIVRVNGVVGNIATMSVASSGRVCTDPSGFSAADLQIIQNGGPLRIGSINLGRGSTTFTAPPPIGTSTNTADTGSAGFFRYDFNRLIAASSGVAGNPVFGSCTVSTFRGMAAAADPIRPDPLDAGAVLNISGPKGSKQLPKTLPGIYFAQLGGAGIQNSTPLYLDKGTYTVDNGSGGVDVGGFRATMNVPDPLVWTNMDAVNMIPRTLDLLITWSGGDPAGFVTIVGSSISSTTPPQVGASFLCIERVSAGRFAVPSIVLQILPPSGLAGGGGFTIPLGFLTVGSSTTPARFTAPGLDLGIVTSFFSSSKGVSFN